MGQCVSSSDGGGGDSTTATNASSGQPEPRCCQASGCQRSNDPTSSSRYCAQHAALCRRQGCSRPRYRKGPYCQEHLYKDTCRVSKCSNDQAKVIDAWFTNNSCLEHQPEDVLRAYFYGDAAEPDSLASGAEQQQQQQQQVNNNNHRQRARRRRSRPKSKPIPVPALAPSDERSSDSDDGDATGHRLSTIGEDAAGDVDPLRPSIMKLAEEPRDADEPATPRRSQKTVHFADSPPRPSTAEKRPVVAEVWSTTEPPANEQPPPPPSHRLRTSRNRRSLDGRRQSPRTSSSAVTVAGHGRERRYHPGGRGGSGNNSSSSSKAADGKRTTRTRSNR